MALILSPVVGFFVAPVVASRASPSGAAAPSAPARSVASALALAALLLGACGSSAGVGGPAGYAYYPTTDAGPTDGGAGRATAPDASAPDASVVSDTGGAGSAQDSGGTCTPTCGSNECGPDGCGGVCGACPAAAPICANGVCKATCTPACGGKVCGGDGCGGSCGSCGAGASCQAGACKAEVNACDVTGYEGCCQGDMLLFCVDGKSDMASCATSGKSCGWNPTAGYYDCVAKPGGADPSGTHPYACGASSGGGKPLAQLKAVQAAIVDNGDYFPTWLAHLYGSKVGALGTLHFLTVTVENPGSANAAVKVTGGLPGYAQAAVKLVQVPAKGAKTVVLDPTWSPQLYKLSSPVPGKATVTLEIDGKLVDTGEVALKVLPVDTVLWSASTIGGAAFDALDSVVTLITPNDLWLQTVLTAAAKQSVFGSMTGYQYTYGTKVYGSNLPALKAEVAAGTSRKWIAYYTAGNVVNLDVDVTCGACWSYNAGYGLVSLEDFSAYMDGTGGKPLAEATTLGSFKQTVVVPKTGYYVHVAWNPTSNSSSRAFTISREMSIYEGAADQLSAIYDALVAYNLVYVNVPGSYFGGAQNIKTVSETLLTGSANCIDGAIVFAAALEAMGMEPAILVPKGHAFVAVRCWKGPTSCFVPLETTAMGSQVSAAKAIAAGFGQLSDVKSVVDVQALRAKGWLPAPL